MKITYDTAIHSIGPCAAILSVTAEKLADRHQTFVKAPTEAELVSKLFDEYKLLPCPIKEGVFRTPTECQRVRKEWKGPTDKTEYARSIGYTGTKPVIVVDGKVQSHRRMGWFQFCNLLHDRKQPA